MMDKKDAIDYLLYMKHDVQAGSPVDVAIDTAIEALKETEKKPKRNSEKLMEQSLYDFLLKMQYELELCRQHSEPYPCIINALGENLVGVRCTKYNRKCNECLQSWMSEETPF